MKIVLRRDYDEEGDWLHTYSKYKLYANGSLSPVLRNLLHTNKNRTKGIGAVFIQKEIDKLIHIGLNKKWRKKMKKINLNILAKDVAAREKGKKEVNIAQIKEVMKCTFEELIGSYPPSAILEVLERYA